MSAEKHHLTTSKQTNELKVAGQMPTFFFEKELQFFYLLILYLVEPGGNM